MARAKVSRRIIAQTIARKLLTEPERRQHWIALGAAYLVENKQSSKVEQLVQDIAREVQLQSGVLLASVTSAHELTDEIKSRIAASLAAKTGASEVRLDASVDAALLSGYVARTPDYEVNTTAQYRLRQLKSLEA
jgi:F0F1-type ATP synthase delta subunit